MSKPFQNPDNGLLLRISALEKQVAALQSSGMLSNASIRAFLDPTPGANRGLRIVDNLNRERVRLGIDEAGNYGLSAGDGTRERIRVGQISSGYGAEAFDASGNLIWDTSGLQAVGAVAVTNDDLSTVATVGAVTNSVLMTVTPTFTVSRARPHIVLATLSGQITSGTGQCSVHLHAHSPTLGDADLPSAPITTGGSSSNNYPMWALATLDPGSTISVQLTVPASTTFTRNFLNVLVIGLGN